MRLFTGSSGGGASEEYVATQCEALSAAAIATHELEGDPHAQYLTPDEADALYDALGDASVAVAAHEGASDPHPGYLNAAEGDAAYQPLDGDLTTIAANITAAGHALLDDASAAVQRATLGLDSVDNTSDAGKPISTATQSALDGKAATSHGVHVPAGGTTGQALKKASDTNGDVEWADDETSVGGGNPLDAWPVGSVFIAVVSTSPATLLGGGTWAAFGAGRVLVGLDAGQTEFDTVEETGGAKTHTLVSGEMPAHTHTQDSHNHTQDAHTHTQNSHNHTQDAHQHGMAEGTTDGSGTFMDRSNAAAATTAVTDLATATNQAATAVNQDATATNQVTTATNQNTGGGGAHNNLQPYIVVYMWKRTA